MVVGEVLRAADETRVIARAILEDCCEPEKVDNWIVKYYAQLMRLRECETQKSDIMFYFSVVTDHDERIYGQVSGFFYEDIKEDVECYLGVELLECEQYASLYVPDYSISRYGEEVIASEALREYGFNSYDEEIRCPEDTKKAIKDALANMKRELFFTDVNYYDRCRLQFCKAYEGKEIPQWEDAKTAKGVKDNRSKADHLLLF